jgi:hypothetical protein
LQPVADVHYAINNRKSGLALDVRDGSTTDGARLEQCEYIDHPQQLWVLEPTRSYYMRTALA